MREINILGIMYGVEFVPYIEGEHAGKTDFINKKIYILEKLEEEEYFIVFRHEMLHAFLYECGLNKYNQDEILLDFFAMQWPKLNDLFDKELKLY